MDSRATNYFFQMKNENITGTFAGELSSGETTQINIKNSFTVPAGDYQTSIKVTADGYEDSDYSNLVTYKSDGSGGPNSGGYLDGTLDWTTTTDHGGSRN